MILSKDEIIKSEILNAAEVLFRRYGLKKTTMEEIASVMGKGKSTLYYYYKSKEEIFYEVILKQLFRNFERLNRVVNEVENAEKKLALFIKTQIVILKEDSNLYSIIRSEIKDGLWSYPKIRSVYIEKNLEIISHILTFGIQSGEFDSSFIEDMDVLPHYIAGAIKGVEGQLFVDEISQDVISSRIDIFITLLINGLKTKKH